MYNRSMNLLTSKRSNTVLNDTRLFRPHPINNDGNNVQDATKQSLLQLIHQHQDKLGWILLIAPTCIPNKLWAEQYQLSLQHVLIIHEKQIKSLTQTVQRALESTSCKVVINFAPHLDKQQLENFSLLAIKNNTCFYQYEHIEANQLTH